MHEDLRCYKLQYTALRTKDWRTLGKQERDKMTRQKTQDGTDWGSGDVSLQEDRVHGYELISISMPDMNIIDDFLEETD